MPFEREIIIIAVEEQDNSKTVDQRVFLEGPFLIRFFFYLKGLAFPFHASDVCMVHSILVLKDD